MRKGYENTIQKENKPLLAKEDMNLHSVYEQELAIKERKEMNNHWQ